MHVNFLSCFYGDFFVGNKIFFNITLLLYTLAEQPAGTMSSRTEYGRIDGVCVRVLPGFGGTARQKGQRPWRTS